MKRRDFITLLGGVAAAGLLGACAAAVRPGDRLFKLGVARIRHGPPRGLTTRSERRWLCRGLKR
jgi:hypothetical protein